MQEHPDIMALKIALHERELGPSNTQFPGPNQVHVPNGILIGLAVLQGLQLLQTDRLIAGIRCYSIHSNILTLALLPTLTHPNPNTNFKLLQCILQHFPCQPVNYTIR